jgi:hypothetical protein
MRRASIVLMLALIGCSEAYANADPHEAVVTTADVHAFIQAFRSLDADDPGCAPLERYLSSGTPGLEAFRKFIGDAEDLCAAIRSDPDSYASIAAAPEIFDTAAEGIEDLYMRFRDFYPPAVFPDVYFLVGRGMSSGMAMDRGIILSAERNTSSTDGMTCLVAHELVHAQQKYPKLTMRWPGSPSFLSGTVLAYSVKEGAADMIADVFAGCPPSPGRVEYAKRQGPALWREFREEMLGHDFTPWLYNGKRGDRPSDMGYYMGYLITRAYYDKAADKQVAIGEILTIRDFEAFLEASGFDGCLPSVIRCAGISAPGVRSAPRPDLGGRDPEPTDP